ncbi:MAG TPA: hypothetical protein VHX44_10900 [Planctomycetota bacterium]|nr:hypothetical protein [Planctomycetota bacterium]
MIVRTIRLLVDVVVGGAAWALLVPWCWGVLTTQLHAVTGAPPEEYALFAGLVVGLALAFWHRPNLFIHTWLHESAHALVCLLLFVRVGAFRATAGQGGEVRHEPVDPLRTVPILIAPYVLPLILGPILFARWLSPDGLLRSGLTFACGTALFMHLHGLALNLRLNTFGAAADIPRVGHLLAFALIVAALLLIAAATVVVLWSTHPPAWWNSLFAV